MTFDPTHGTHEPGYSEELREFSKRSVKHAWSGLIVSAILLGIAAMTIHGLRSGNLTETQRRAYFMIVWLFGVRFLYSAWRLYRTGRDLGKFRRGIERQLELMRIGQRPEREAAESDTTAA